MFSNEIIGKAFQATRKFCIEDLSEILSPEAQNAKELESAVYATLMVAAESVEDGATKIPFRKRDESADDADGGGKGAEGEKTKGKRRTDDELKAITLEIGENIIDKFASMDSLTEGDAAVIVFNLCRAFAHTFNIQEELVAAILKELVSK